MKFQTKGIVVRETPKGETSKLLTVITSTHGVITVNAKGVRRLSSPFLKASQLFAFSELLLHENNGFYTLSDAVLITDFYPLRKDIKKYALACYLCELASDFSVPGEDSGIILRLLLNSLYAVENSLASEELIKAAFEIRLCAECGFPPDATCCAECGNDLSKSDAVFDIAEGVIFCTDCSSHSSERVLLTPSVIKAINHIVEKDMSKFIAFRISDRDMGLLCSCAEKYILARAERGFKTLSFYKHCEEI
ncbi:MAG: DNA repair protein RecO [Clostridia bacterium]|nr:DNA repair protein RecO [Clostridia bacterium]